MKKILMVAITLLAISCSKDEINRKDYRTVKIINKSGYPFFVNTTNKLTRYYNDTCYHECMVGDTLNVVTKNSTLNPVYSSFEFYVQNKGKGSFKLTKDYSIGIDGYTHILLVK
jgi:hypothetical protein